MLAAQFNARRHRTATDGIVERTCARGIVSLMDRLCDGRPAFRARFLRSRAARKRETPPFGRGFGCLILLGCQQRWLVA